MLRKIAQVIRWESDHRTVLLTDGTIWRASERPDLAGNSDTMTDPTPSRRSDSAPRRIRTTYTQKSDGQNIAHTALRGSPAT